MGERTGRPRGRPAGARNRRSERLEAAVATVTASAIAGIDDPFEGDAHTFLMAVYKNRAHDLSVRIDAAKAAIRYEKPALANIDAQHSGPDGGSISFTWEPPVEP